MQDSAARDSRGHPSGVPGPSQARACPRWKRAAGAFPGRSDPRDHTL